MSIKQRYVYFTLVLVYKCLNGLAPEYLSSQITLMCNNTRSAATYNVVVPFPHTEMFKRSFSYSGPTLWNKLPVSIKEAQSLGIFKSLLKDYVLKNH